MSGGGGAMGWLQRTWSRRRSATSAAANSSQDRNTAAPTHLVVLVNGLFGSASNWDVMCEQLQGQLPPTTLLHASQANARFATYAGIDACGQRLADEVRGVVAAAGPSLTRISIIAHSMGGLMARYAIGCLFNPSTRTLCGLEPCHFVTMATPHCGCDADGVAQVPFIGWTGDIPLLGQQLYRFLSNISGSTASLIFQRTGQQFFMLDGAGSVGAGDVRAAAAAAGGSTSSTSSSGQGSASSVQLPLLLQITQDCPDRGLYFYSALAAFKTRTCYGNMDGDHLVGFANSSLRTLQQLPPPPPEASAAKGVVLEDSLAAAFWPHTWQQLQQQWAGAETTTATAAAACEAIRQPHSTSRDWTQVQHQQQHQQQQGEVVVTAASSNGSSSWHELSGSRSASASTAWQQQQQQSAAEVAALELEATGAVMASTAAAAAAAAAAMHFSPMQPAPAAAAAGRQSPAAGDNADEVVDLRYSSPVPQQQQQQPAARSIDGPSQPQQPQQRGSTAAAAAQDAAAVASAEADLTSGLSGPPVAAAKSAAAAASDVAADAAAMAAAGSSRAAVVAHMLRRLQELPWRRIDVSFQGARFGFAHNNIQVTRRWWNFEGRTVPAHIGQQLQLMDALVMGPDEPQ